MKFILAASGGVDSMMMLEMFHLRSRGWEDQLVVAHFNHGMRESADADEELVRRKAEEYGFKFVVGHGNLGPKASEAEARAARYEFLRRVAASEMEVTRDIVGGLLHVHRERAPILTAHHLNDLAETVAINLLRGTGWRGLAVLGMEGVERPFVEMGVSKREILIMAGENNLHFREDPTNNDKKYLRNRVREKVNELDKETLMELKNLRNEQMELKEEIERAASVVANQLRDGKGFMRQPFHEMDELVADEVLRAILRYWNIETIRPQREDFLNAILTYENGKSFNLPSGKMVKMGAAKFSL